MAASLDPASPPMYVATAIPCAAALAAAIGRGWHRRGPVGPPVPAAPAALSAVWALLIGAIVAFQLAMFTSSPRRAYPTLSSLAAIAFDWRPARAGAFALWLVLGLVLLRR